MKRIVLAVMLAILTHLSAAQERIVLRMDDFVKVYIDYLNNNCFCKLLPQLEFDSNLSYYAIVLDKQGERFKLKITMSDILGDLESEPVIGWVEARECGVFLLCNNYSDSVPLLSLYEGPSSESVVEIIDISSINGLWVSIKDIYNGFVQVSFGIHGKIYSGWISRYCTDPYNSCT